MSTEIELKYLVSIEEVDSGYISSQISALLKAEKLINTYSEKVLINDYFDTADLALRQMDFGLRIRNREGQFEQTIKTAGKVVSGLHQRPEYNVDIKSNNLNLALFPQHIWPENVDTTLLEAKLGILFSTNFTRQAWLIHYGDSIIELALDRGIINTDACTKSLDICELEIELVKGEQSALFALAEQLKTITSLEPGNLSKAARGYTLSKNNKQSCQSSN
jgi:triphosphatase